MELRESNRRLAAILFTDIVGYTAMMQQDEKIAMTAVRKHHEVIQKCVTEHGGEIHQYFGDGCMCIFNSATDAVHCAYAFQKELLRQPEVLVRTGIHIGEIYVEGGKIFGDGVNLASRIESIGQGGTVLFSRDVFEKVRNHTEFQIKSIGSFEFKNVNDALQVFALVNPGLRIPDVKAIEGKLKDQVKKKRPAVIMSIVGVILSVLILLALYLYPKDAMTSPELVQYTSSIAVLPFDNQSDKPDDEFLSTGLAEDILTQLAQINGLKVIARTSSMKYKDYESEGKSLWDVSKELGVTNILEGSVRRYENRLRFTVRLVDPKQENILWAQEFDREIEDVLNVQREIALAVSNQLQISLSPALQNRLVDKDNVNSEAYVNYHRGLDKLLLSNGLAEDVEAAKRYFEMAIQADSTFSRAWVGLADASLEAIYWHRTTDGEALPIAREAAEKALEIDPASSEGYCALGAIALYSNDLRQAEVMLAKALDLNPSNAYAYERLAWVKFYSDKSNEAFELLERCIQLDPRSTRYKSTMGAAYYLAKRYDEGIRRMEEFLGQHPADNAILWSLAYLNAGKGEYKKAIDILDLRTIGKKTNWVYSYCYAALGDRKAAQTVVDTLIARDRRGVLVPDFMMAVGLTAVDKHEEALDRLEHATGAGGESFFAWQVKVDPMFKPLHKYPRFKKVVDDIQKMYRY